MSDTALLETTVHDMKTHFSRYCAELAAGEYDGIVVRNRNSWAVKLTRLEEPPTGVVYGIAKSKGYGRLVDDEVFDQLDDDVEALFCGEL